MEFIKVGSDFFQLVINVGLTINLSIQPCNNSSYVINYLLLVNALKNLFSAYITLVFFNFYFLIKEI